MIIFGLVFIKKKVTKPKLKKKNRNRFKPTGFGSIPFFRTKIGSNQFGSVLARFFSFCLNFFGFFSVWVRFGFFSFWLINRTEPVDFFKILISFFLWFGFFSYFFLVFSVFLIFQFFCSPLV